MGDRPLRLGLWYDLRNPVRWRRPWQRLYDATLEQMVWAESLGYDSLWLSEHHFAEDGYLPGVAAVGGALAARTSRVRLGTNLVLLPLHHPFRVAEDAATLALLSRGPFELGVALGYREIEFEVLGKNRKHRPSLLEEGVELIRRAWSGEAVSFQGRRFQVTDVPVPPAAPEPPPLLVGGMSEPAVERAARIGDGFLSAVNDHHEWYVSALERQGKDAREGRIYAGQWWVIDEDPERAWAEVGEHALYQLNTYITWGAFPGPHFADAEQVRRSGIYQIWDAATAVREIRALAAARPQLVDAHFWAVLPGEDPEHASPRLEYVARRVLPELRTGPAVPAVSP